MSQLGLIGNSVLTDIANAIRTQNGGSALYRHSEMAAAVLALDGTQEGTALSKTASEGGGIVDDANFTAIADAIRAQNGQTTTYTPAEMAPAILALEWDTGLKIRAVVLADGTLEFNYLDGRQTTVEGGLVLTAFEVSANGYTSATARPWDEIKTTITKVVFDESFAAAGITNYAYWLSGCTALTEVSGFENVAGATSITQMFTSCGNLQTIYATSFDNSTVKSAGNAFYGCPRLVGGTGYVPTNSSGASVCKLGDGGVLTNPDNDARAWCWGTLYADGVLEIHATDSFDQTRSKLAHGRVCVGASYTALGGMPWNDVRNQVESVLFKDGMSVLGSVSMNYWFYGCTALTDVDGWDNIVGAGEMKYAFTSCTALTTLDLRGLDPSYLTNLTQVFSGCTALTTILADADWALPSGASGSATFYNCKALVGGNGTAYSTSAYGYAYMRIDATGTPGYLTG